MLVFSQPYVVYDDGASRSTQNLSSISWEIYAHNHKLVSLQGIFIGCSTNNMVEYSVVIKLLPGSISHVIHHLVVRLDSQLMVLHLNNVYLVRSPTMLPMFLRVHLLKRHFDYITYQHVPRSINTLTDALANHILDRHL